tara:strand:- start:7228 stop:7989 length:762 start_codon:yes stop_codon:yes gene_type:complete
MWFSKKNRVKYKVEDISKKSFILHHHLGLGDHITLNGMANYLSEKFEKIYIPSKPNNYSTVKFMFEKNKKVEIFEIGSENEYQDIDTFSNLNKLEILKVGFEKLKSLYKYNESFYTQLDLSYDISFDYFDPNYNPEKNKKLEEHLREYYNCKGEYIILHLEGSTGSFDLNSVQLESKLPKILIEKKSDIFSNIFFYLDVINNAKEVHCINSSIFTLVERIPTKGDLYFHNTKKEDSVKKITVFNKKWKFVDYY